MWTVNDGTSQPEPPPGYRLVYGFRPRGGLVLAHTMSVGRLAASPGGGAKSWQ